MGNVFAYLISKTHSGVRSNPGKEVLLKYFYRLAAVPDVELKH